MGRIWERTKSIYRSVVSSIAFYPALMAMFFFFFALFTINFEYEQTVIQIKKSIHFLLVHSKEDARLILGTLVGSIISLMVFSFSMVMVVLNRVSTYLSPRVLPGLISDKTHQFVLGFYLGTIIYSLVLIVNFQAEGDYQIPAFGVLLSMTFGIICLILFIYFIRSISNSIQVGKILEDIFTETLKKLHKDKMKNEGRITEPNTDNWETIKTARSGYFKRIETNRLMGLLNDHDLAVKLEVRSGFFTMADYPFLKVSKKIDTGLENAIRDCFEFYMEDYISDHYVYGIQQISEIAVKALSPAINDPGTAIKSIDMLVILFIQKMELHEPFIEYNKSGKIRIIHRQIHLATLLYDYLIPIREYGKNDASIMLNLLEGMKNLSYADRIQGKHQETLIKYTKSLIQSAEENITNSLDREELNKMIELIKDLLSEPGDIKVLNVDKGVSTG